MVDSPFRIDILDAGGNKLGAGPLKNILQVNTNRVLDKIGSASFIVPANDPKAREIAAGRQFDIVDEVDGYLGRFLFKKMTLSETDGRGLITVECWDALRLLTYQIVGFKRDYEAEAIEDIVSDLLSDASWILDSGTGLGIANITYQGQTIYQAIEELAKRWGYHFRLGDSALELEFGTFGGTVPNFRLTNLGGQSSSFDNVPEIGIMKQIKQSVTDEEVYNLVVALGAGTGKSQLQLDDGEVGDFYTVDSRTRANGLEEFFIEDTASQTAYGTREVVLLFDQIRPIANTDTAKAQAKTELLMNAERWLQRYKDERVQLDGVQVYALKKDVKPGDKVLIRYKQKDDEGNLYVDVDGAYWVTQHVRTRNAQGQRISNLQLVNIDRAEKTDVDILSETVRGIKSEKLWVKPVPFRFSDTYTDFAANSDGLYQDKDAVFTFTIDETVTDVTRVVLEWRTKPLYTTAAWSSTGATNTLPAAPTNPHSHALDLSTVSQIGLFTVLESDNYPTDIVLELSGDSFSAIDISNHADVDYIVGGNGPWNNGGSPNAAVTVRMDITDLILGATGGIYQTFELRFRLTAARSRDVSIPYYTTHTPQNNSTGNQGIFELKVITQGVAQAIPS